MRSFFQRLLEFTTGNPVLLKELRIGLRERRLFVTQLGFLLVLLLFTVGMVASVLAGTEAEGLPEMGKNYFATVFWVQLVLLGVILPGLTCGSLSGERERHSLDMVLASRLSAGEIVGGKLGYAAYYAILLLFSSLPIASVAFFFGGVSPQEAAQAYFELFSLGLLAALVGLIFSAREKRSNYATSQTYMTIFLLGGFLIFPYAALRSVEKAQLPAEFLLTPMQMVAAMVSYLLFFLFVKSAHHLKPQYRYIRLLSVSFMAFYLLFLLLALRGLYVSFGISSYYESSWPIWMIFVAIAHLAWVGMFCNPTLLPSASEQRAFKRSVFSKNLWWMGFFSLGLAAPALLGSALGIPAAAQTLIATSCGLCCVYVLAFPILARALMAVIPGSKFAAVYFVLVSLAMTLPSLGLLFDEPGPFSGIYLSPILALTGLVADTGPVVHFMGSKQSVAAFSALAYVILALLAGLVVQLKKPRC